jgi:probable phosphoglycerate mutase
MPSSINSKAMLTKAVLTKTIALQENKAMLTALNSHTHYRHHCPTRVILLRHGESTYNSLGLYQGSSNLSNLTELGHSQARQTGEFLQGIHFDAIYVSPLQRARETATEVLQATSSPIAPEHIHVAPQLRETDLPNWQGLPFQLVKEQFPEAYHCWKRTPDQFWMEIADTEQTEEIEKAGEDTPLSKQTSNAKQKFFPALDLYDRVQQFWQEILLRHVGQTILIVCHGGTNRALISTALGITPDHYHVIEQSNCALSILNFSNGCLESGQLEVMNSANHTGQQQFKTGEIGQRLFLIPAETCDRDQIFNLAHMLKSTAIDFSLSTDHDRYSQIAPQILQYHPKALQIEALREDFLQLWQQSLDVKNQSTCDLLHTGIVIAGKDAIARFIERVLGIDSPETDLRQRLSIHPGTVSAIRYPGSGHPPLLQAMNIDLSCDLINQLKLTTSESDRPVFC